MESEMGEVKEVVLSYYGRTIWDFRDRKVTTDAYEAWAV
jgi:hypothetical protein